MKHVAGQVRWTRKSGRLIAVALLVGLPLAVSANPAGAAELLEVRTAKYADFTRVVFETDGPIWYSLENRSRETGEIELIIPVTSAQTKVRELDLPARGVSLEALPDNSGSRALLKVEGPLDIWTNQLQDPPRIVLDLRTADQSAVDPANASDDEYEIVAGGSAPEAPASVPAVSATTRDVGADPKLKRSAPRKGAFTRHPLFWVSLVCLAMGVLVYLYVMRVSRREIVRRAPADRVGANKAAASRARAPGPRAFQGGRGLEKTAPKSAPARETGDKAAAPAKVTEGVTASAAAEIEATRPVSKPAPARDAQGETMSESTPTPDQRAQPTTASEPGGYAEVLELLRGLDDRLAKLEGAFSTVRNEQGQLRDRSLAQAEEIRAHRAAVARLLRRPAAHSGRPGVGTSSS